VQARRLHLHVSDDELARRGEQWRPPEKKFDRGYGMLFSRSARKRTRAATSSSCTRPAGPRRSGHLLSSLVGIGTMPPERSGNEQSRGECGECMITSLSIQRSAARVLAVPALCRNADLSLNEARTRSSSATSNRAWTDAALRRKRQPLPRRDERTRRVVVDDRGNRVGDTLVIPSVAPTFGAMMDQAKIVRRHKFPTVMVLPLVGSTTSSGVEAGIRRIRRRGGRAGAAVHQERRVHRGGRGRQLAESRVISGIKYAVVRRTRPSDPICKSLTSTSTSG
jgi:hypothetical protein